MCACGIGDIAGDGSDMTDRDACVDIVDSQGEVLASFEWCGVSSNSLKDTGLLIGENDDDDDDDDASASALMRAAMCVCKSGALIQY